jgi:methanogenic corrinoid protein MtbC1
VVGLSCALAAFLDETAGVVRALRSIPDAPTIIVGGAAFADDPGAAASIGADLFARDAAEASRLLRQRFS